MDPLLRQELKRMVADRRNAAAPALLATWAALAAPWLGFAFAPGVSTGAVAFVVTGFMQYRLVLSCHEAVHRTLLFPGWLNEAVGLLHCALVGMHFRRYRAQHLHHHRVRTVGDDPDAYIYAPILRARAGWPRVAVWIAGAAQEAIEKIRQKGVPAPAPEAGGAFDALAIVGAQAGLCAACWALGAWWAYPLLWLAPLGTIALFLNRSRVLVEHGYPLVRAGIAASDGAPQQTVDLEVGRLEGILFAGFLFHYHYAHHRAPSLPHQHNRRFAALLREHEPDAPSPVRGSYARALRTVLLGPPGNTPA